jgi:hypothetical protein
MTSPFRMSQTFLFILTLTAGLSACGDGPGGVLEAPVPLPRTATEDPINPPVVDTEPPAEVPNNPPAPVPTPTTVPIAKTDVLLFNGIGVDTSDWQNTEAIIKSDGLSYKLANSAQLNAMTLQQMLQFRAMVVPGGVGQTITNALTTATRIRVRQAVRDHGLNYVGICAGAWVAVGPEANGNQTAAYGMSIAYDPGYLKLYYPNGTLPTAAIVNTNFANGTSRRLVWWGGPYTPNWAGGVVARYSSGEPAISQKMAGKGFVIIAGPHPEAPQSWRNTAGYDSDGLDYPVFLDMVHAALEQKPLPTY